MKMYVVASVLAIAAVIGGVLWKQYSPAQAHRMWKRYAMEPETKVRPDRFKDMVFQPAEVRAPASVK